MRRTTDAGIGWITLDRPRAMNAVTVALAVDLHSAITELAADPAVNVIVVRGAGGNFCAGGDFTEVEHLRAEGQPALTELFAEFRRACDAIGRIDVPLVAAVEGVAAAGGFELMQAADIVLVSEDARIADSHVKFGMIPGGGSTIRLPRVVGRQRALGLLLSGDAISGSDAVRLGLAHRSFPHSEFATGVEQFALTLAGRSAEAVSAIKRLVYFGLDHTLAAGLDAEMAAVVRHIAGRAGRDGVEKLNTNRREEVNR